MAIFQPRPGFYNYFTTALKNKQIINQINPIIAVIQSGHNTQIQDHAITFVSLRTINTIVKSEEKPILIL